jgi:RHH-type proline utilization regulon transcriptional repressor/proline dehydrogenase/delta 1-pyrroline-5-carboxylate dehydrogenase
LLHCFAEGLALMCLAEALLRVPDAETAIALTADQLGRAAFEGGAEDGAHRMLAQLSASAIALSKKLLPGSDEAPGLMQRLGARTVVAATVRAIGLLGRQFVLGRHIDEAMAEAQAQRRSEPALRFSYDMLGEGARTRPMRSATWPRTARPSSGSRRARAAAGLNPRTASRSSSARCSRATRTRSASA